MTYTVLKTLHLISFVSWFSALLYGVRLFVYHAEALENGGAAAPVLHAQFSLMSRRLWRAIGHPAMLATAFFGFWLMFEIRAWTQPWFQLKLVLIAGLLAYHFYLQYVRRQLAEKRFRGTSRGLRVWNEVGTLFLVAIVAVAVSKSVAAPFWAMGIFTAFGALIFGVLAFRQRK